MTGDHEAGPASGLSRHPFAPEAVARAGARRLAELFVDATRWGGWQAQQAIVTRWEELRAGAIEWAGATGDREPPHAPACLEMDTGIADFGVTDARDPERIETVVDLFTRAAAEDYLEGTARKLTEPLAAWRNGRRVPRAMRRSSDPVAVPGIDGLFTDLPVLTTEAERLATQLELVDGTWHTLMAQGRVAGVLDRLHALERGEAREALCLASRIDMSARRPAAALLAEVRGPGGARGEPPRIRSGLLRGPGTGALAGAATAAAAQAVLAGEVPPGLHYAAEILDPARTIDRVCAAPGVEVRVVDGPVELVDPAEEGEL